MNTTTAAAAAAVLRRLATRLRDANSHQGEWHPSGQAAKDEYYECLRLASELDSLPTDVPITRLDPHHAELRLALAGLTGATAGALKAIHAAGGYHVYDPAHQTPIQRAIQGLEAAYVVATSAASQPMHGD